MSGKNIQVAIKMRPLLKKELESKLTSNWKIINNSIHLIESQAEPFYFDHIFDQDVPNEIIFNKVAKPIVDASLQGFNGTIFAYGQTSSGKTYTMLGDDNNPGVMYLAAKEIFKEIENASDHKFLLRVGYIEIYNEKIYDLLNKNNQDLKIYETVNGDVSVNCEDPIITSELEMMHYLQTGSKLRKCGETNVNERSSRSHALFRLTIESRKVDLSDDNSTVQTSILNLVDLAGSERADQTGATGLRLNEGRHINRSLLYLSCVIKRLSENETDKYINYRDTKLTRILQASLGGNALTAIICTIKPTSVEETNSTLNFAMRAKTIKNKPEINETVSDAAMMKRLEKEIKRLETALEIEKNKNNKISENHVKVLQLEKQIKEERLKIIHPNTIGGKQKNIRRRTWCPTYNGNSTENLEESHLTESEPNSTIIEVPLAHMMTPLISIRDEFMFDQKSHDLLFENLNNDIKKESNNLLNTSIDIRTPKCLKVNNKLSSLSPSPSFKNKYLGLLNEIEELRIFTSLEKKFDVEHETINSLSIRLEESQRRINELLNQEITLKLVIDDLKEKGNTAFERIQHLEVIISEDDKNLNIIKHQLEENTKENKELIEKNQQIELEYREKISIDFELNQFKIKFKNRETELIEAINEKDNTIAILRKELQNKQNIHEEILNKTKTNEAHLKASLTEKDDTIFNLKKVIQNQEMECNKCNHNTDVILKLEKNLELFQLENKRIQKEYNEVSTELIESMEENETLKNQINSLNFVITEYNEIKNELIRYKEKLLDNNVTLNRVIIAFKERNCDLMTKLSINSKKIAEDLNENIKLTDEVSKLQIDNKSEKLYISFLLQEIQHYLKLLTEKHIETGSVETQINKTEENTETNIITSSILTKHQKSTKLLLSLPHIKNNSKNENLKKSKINLQITYYDDEYSFLFTNDLCYILYKLYCMKLNHFSFDNIPTLYNTNHSTLTYKDQNSYIRKYKNKSENLICTQNNVIKISNKVSGIFSNVKHEIKHEIPKNESLNNQKAKKCLCLSEVYENNKELLSKCESQRAKYEIEINDLKNILIQKNIELKIYMDKINLLQTEKNIINNKNEKLNDEINNHIVELNSKTNSINSLTKLNTDYSNMLNNNEIVIKQMETECISLKKSTSKLKEYIIKLEEESRLLRNDKELAEKFMLNNKEKFENKIQTILSGNDYLNIDSHNNNSNCDIVIPSISELALLTSEKNSDEQYLKDNFNQNKSDLKSQEKLKVQNNSIEIEQNSSRQSNQKERKYRRQSTHDEKRQSLWDSYRSVSTMTSPTDQLCNCVQLNETVSDLKKKVIIKDSQIETLRLELKSNQYKDDVKKIQKMLLEEENENRNILIENKKLKQLLIESKAMMVDTTDEVKSLNQKLGNLESLCAEQAENILKFSNECKYLETICKKQNDQIEKLEKQITENLTDKNDIKQELKNLNDENQLLKRKYYEAKALCYIRIEEIASLKTQITDLKMKSDVQIANDKINKLSNTCEDLRKICRLRNEKIKELEKELLHEKCI